MLVDLYEFDKYTIIFYELNIFILIRWLADLLLRTVEKIAQAMARLLLAVNIPLT